jgi:hypothetical protein
MTKVVWVVYDCDVLSVAWVAAPLIMPYLLLSFSNEIMIKFVSVVHISISHHLYWCHIHLLCVVITYLKFLKCFFWMQILTTTHYTICVWWCV